MNKHPNSNLNGRTVPIFANNKKKRLKQALYANPSWNDCSDSSTSDNYDDLPGDGNFFEGSEPSHQKGNFRQPLQQLHGKFGLIKKEGCFGYASDSINPSTPQCQQITRRGIHIGSNFSSCSGRSTGMKPVGMSDGFRAKGTNQRSLNSNDFAQKNKVSAGENGSRMLQSRTCPGRGVTQSNISTLNESSRNKTIRENSLNIGLETFSVATSQSTQQNQNFPASKDIYSKQVNLMATPSDKSLKVITATVKDVQKWNQFRDKLALLYEIFGYLNSQVSPNPAGNGKNFVIKDTTGNLRCIFWEMDRKLPRLTRGQMHRCIGTLDRKNGIFNCVSVRPVKLVEQKVITSFLESSGLAMQKYLAAFKED